MTTLIAVYNSEGLVGRCDARCYEGRDERCNCVCGGANHGAGEQRAVDNTREHAEKWLVIAAQGGEVTRFALALLTQMTPLFDLPPAPPTERRP